VVLIGGTRRLGGARRVQRVTGGGAAVAEEKEDEGRVSHSVGTKPRIRRGGSTVLRIRRRGTTRRPGCGCREGKDLGWKEIDWTRGNV